MEKSLIERDPHNKSFDGPINESNPIRSIFNGCYQNFKNCKSCNEHDSKDLILDIRGVNNVEDACNQHFAEEKLDGVICEECQANIDPLLFKNALINHRWRFA